LVEAEWAPGRWRVGHVVDVLGGGGRATVRYNDGLLWVVEPHQLRPIGSQKSRGGSLSPVRCDSPAVRPHKALQAEHAECKALRSESSLTGSPRASDVDSSLPGSGGSNYSRTSSLGRECHIHQQLSEGSHMNRLHSQSCIELGSAKLHELPGAAPQAATPSRRAIAASGANAKIELGVSAAAITAASREAADLQPRLSFREWNGAQGARDARDTVTTMEVDSCQKHAEAAAEAALLSGDWWQLQAAMQLVTSTGLGDRWLPLLRQATREAQEEQQRRPPKEPVAAHTFSSRSLRAESCRPTNRRRRAGGCVCVPQSWACSSTKHVREQEVEVLVWGELISL
jgi:hypothetical protein